MTGQNYSVEYSPDIGSGNWIPLPGDAVSGNGQQATVADPNPVTSGGQRFYRVKQVP